MPKSMKQLTDEERNQQRNTKLQRSRDKSETGYRFKQWDQVRNYVKNYRDLLSSTPSVKNTGALAAQRKRLDELLDTLRRDERALYAALNVRDLQDLQAKINNWNKSGARYLLSNDAVNMAMMNLKVVVDEAKMIQVLNEQLEAEALTEDIINARLMGGQTVAEYLNMAFGESGKQFRSLKTRGVNAQLEFALVDGKLRIRRKGDTVFTDVINKLATAVNDVLGDNTIPLYSVNYQDAMNLIEEDIKSHISDSRAMECIRHELIVRADDYTKYGYRAVVQGWLGEIYWNAAINYVTNSSISIPSGRLKNTKGQSLSVDIIFANLPHVGFQVKNWSMANDLQHFDGTETLRHEQENKNRKFGTFMKDRAEMINDYIGKTIAEMFGAYAYNLPNLDYGADEVLGNMNESYSQFYEREFKSSPPTNDVQALNPFFSQYIDKIIGIDRSEEIAADKVQTDMVHYYRNTIWAIGDTLFPSSVIIEEMIRRLDHESVSDLVSFELHSITQKERGAVWPEETNIDLANITNRFRISYTVTFNLGELMKAVYGQIQQNRGQI